MSGNLFDYVGFPSREQRTEIENSFPHLDGLFLNIDSSKLNSVFLFFSWYEFRCWLRQFNNRIGEVHFSYMMAIYYHSMEIPDKEWWISPGNKGQSVEYYPNFSEEHFYIKYFFDFYSEVFYVKIFGALDLMYHLINIFYELNIQNFAQRFKSNVINKLKECDGELASLLENLSKHEVYSTAITIRNNFIHNFPCNDISPGVNRTSLGVTVFGVGDYIPSDELKKNMEDLILLVGSVLTELKTHFYHQYS